MTASPLSGLQAVQLLLLGLVALLIAVAPLACWSVLGRMLRVQRKMLDELHVLNAQIRAQRRSTPLAPSNPEDWPAPFSKR